MEALLDDGACLDGSESHRPLIAAVFNRHQAVAKLLIEKGADDVNSACTTSQFDRGHHQLRHLGAPYNGELRFKGETPLSVAACSRIVYGASAPRLRRKPQHKRQRRHDASNGGGHSLGGSQRRGPPRGGRGPLAQDLEGYTALHHAAFTATPTP